MIPEAEASDGKPKYPDSEYGYCTCGKVGCDKRIRYPVAEKFWRPRYCAFHLREETLKLKRMGFNEIQAYPYTHIQLRDVKFKSVQETIDG